MQQHGCLQGTKSVDNAGLRVSCSTMLACGVVHRSAVNEGLRVNSSSMPACPDRGSAHQFTVSCKWQH